MWSFKYQVEWQNGTTAVGDTTDTRVTLSGLEAVTEYAVTITAFTDSTLCAEQSVNFTFNTAQSKWWLALHTNHDHSPSPWSCARAAEPGA